VGNARELFICKNQSESCILGGSQSVNSMTCDETVRAQIICLLPDQILRGKGRVFRSSRMQVCVMVLWDDALVCAVVAWNNYSCMCVGMLWAW
jgi:hypothetical protein